MPKNPYKARGRPDRNLRNLRRQRAIERGASKPGTTPNLPHDWPERGGEDDE